jgi:hypothetical protein
MHGNSFKIKQLLTTDFTDGTDTRLRLASAGRGGENFFF